MTHTIESFSAECHRLIAAENGPAGREKVRKLLESVLQDEAFVSKYLDPLDAPKTVLYEDPEFGFLILGHSHKGSNDGNPHDHGPSWAVYGQARGETTMTEWKHVGPVDKEGRQPVDVRERYVLTPGKARLYNERVIHSTKRDAATRLIRITCTDVDKVVRGRYRKATAEATA